MSDTLNLSQRVLNEKTAKIIPENIKKDITIFGVTGTCAGAMSEQEYNDALDTINDILGNQGGE